MIALEHRGAALKNLNLGALGVTLDQGDGKILSRQIVRSTKADDASAANNHAPSLAHDNQYSTTQCGRNQSSFSCRISSSLFLPPLPRLVRAPRGRSSQPEFFSCQAGRILGNVFGTGA